MATEIEWPLQPNGKPVPNHRRSWKAYAEGYPIFCASNWKRIEVKGSAVGHWVCGYCQKTSTDTLSPRQYDTLADCRKCGKTNRISR